MSEQDSCAEIVFEAKVGAVLLACARLTARQPANNSPFLPVPCALCFALFSCVCCVCFSPLQLAEQTERYDEMKENMKEVVKAKKSLSKEERNLLSVAYKNVVGARRASWRVLHSFSKSKEEGFDKQRELVDEYRRKVEDEIDDICEEILTLLEHTLLKNCQEDAEATVFYLKMMGDYLRYLAEVTEKEKRKQSADRACDAYNKAQEASTRLAPTNPIRLGLALNFSVFYYEIMNLREKACELAKNAFDLVRRLPSALVPRPVSACHVLVAPS